jgi:hypothetical protein
MKYALLCAIALITFIVPAAAWDGPGWGNGKSKTYVDDGAIRAGQEAAADALHAKEMEDGRRGWVERTYHCSEQAGTCPAPGSSDELLNHWKRSDIAPAQRFAQNQSGYGMMGTDPCQGSCPGCGGVKCGDDKYTSIADDCRTNHDRSEVCQAGCHFNARTLRAYILCDITETELNARCRTETFDYGVCRGSPR